MEQELLISDHILLNQPCIFSKIDVACLDDDFLFKYFKGLEFTDKIAIAVSAGKDSILLLHLFLKYVQAKQKSPKIYCINIDHGQREAAKKDKKLVKEICKQNNINFLHKKIRKIKKPTQEFLRKERYIAFYKLCKKNNIRILLLGHNLNDFVETNILKQQRNNNIYYQGIRNKISLVKNAYEILIYRPILSLKRDEIDYFIKKFGLEFIEDETNSQVKYKRNFLRLRQRKLIEANLQAKKINKINKEIKKTEAYENKIKYLFFAQNGFFNPLGQISFNLRSPDLMAKKNLYLAKYCVNILARQNNISNVKIANILKNDKSQIAGVTIEKEGNKLLFSREDGIFTRKTNNFKPQKWKITQPILWDNRFKCEFKHNLDRKIASKDKKLLRKIKLVKIYPKILLSNLKPEEKAKFLQENIIIYPNIEQFSEKENQILKDYLNIENNMKNKNTNIKGLILAWKNRKILNSFPIFVLKIDKDDEKLSIFIAKNIADIKIMVRSILIDKFLRPYMQIDDL